MKKILFFIVSVILFASCSNDDITDYSSNVLRGQYYCINNDTTELSIYDFDKNTLTVYSDFNTISYVCTDHEHPKVGREEIAFDTELLWNGENFEEIPVIFHNNGDDVVSYFYNKKVHALRTNDNTVTYNNTTWYTVTSKNSMLLSSVNGNVELFKKTHNDSYYLNEVLMTYNIIHESTVITPNEESNWIHVYFWSDDVSLQYVEPNMYWNMLYIIYNIDNVYYRNKFYIRPTDVTLQNNNGIISFTCNRCYLAEITEIDGRVQTIPEEIGMNNPCAVQFELDTNNKIINNMVVTMFDYQDGNINVSTMCFENIATNEIECFVK